MGWIAASTQSSCCEQALYFVAIAFSAQLNVKFRGHSLPWLEQLGYSYASCEEAVFGACAERCPEHAASAAIPNAMELRRS